MIYVNWMFGEIEKPVDDIEAHFRLIEEGMRKLIWAEGDQKEKIRQEIDWRLREINRLANKMKTSA